MCTAVEYRPYTGLSMEPCCHTRRCATITSQHGTSGLLERAAITHCAGCAANDRPIIVSAEMHAISQRGLEGGDAPFEPLETLVPTKISRALDMSLDLAAPTLLGKEPICFSPG